jgi:hypothetical protein
MKVKESFLSLGHFNLNNGDVLITAVRVGHNGSRAAPAGSGSASVAFHWRSRILRYGGQVSMRFGPMASRWQGASIFAHLERRRLTVAAGDGGMI